jgi:hypothetical protein
MVCPELLVSVSRCVVERSRIVSGFCTYPMIGIAQVSNPGEAVSGKTYQTLALVTVNRNQLSMGG